MDNLSVCRFESELRSLTPDVGLTDQQVRAIVGIYAEQVLTLLDFAADLAADGDDDILLGDET